MDFEKIRTLTKKELRVISLESLTTSKYIQEYLKENGATKEVVDRMEHNISYTYSATSDCLGGDFVRHVDAKEDRDVGSITMYSADGSLLHFACCEEEPLLVRYLLVVCDADVNSVFGGAKRAPPSFTPMRVAFENKNPQTQQILREWCSS